MKLSFARAKGRNYRRLPDRARLREKPSPADILYLELCYFRVAGSWRDAFFGAGVLAQKPLGFDMRVGTGIEMGG